MNKHDYATNWGYYNNKLETIAYLLQQYPKSKKLLKQKEKYTQIMNIHYR